MSKFKIGDKVMRVVWSDTLEVGEVYTVEYFSPSGLLKVRGNTADFDPDNFKLVSDNEIIRKEITGAVETLTAYKIWRNGHGYLGQVKNNQGYSLDVFLDKYYPTKTPQQLGIESIRKEQEKLAARLKELEK